MAEFTPAKCPPDCQFAQTLENIPCCGYFALTGHLRGCDPGPGCKRYRPATVNGKHRKRAKWDTEKGRELWLQGKSDRQIAAAVGVSQPAVGFYRRKHWEAEVASDG